MGKFGKRCNRELGLECGLYVEGGVASLEMQMGKTESLEVSGDSEGSGGMIVKRRRRPDASAYVLRTVVVPGELEVERSHAVFQNEVLNVSVPLHACEGGMQQSTTRRMCQLNRLRFGSGS
uniref:SHSP domain-containing protein n=1 Tax=Rhodosorus marinus TaxID=101924 RepID=A0A7S0BUH9_9RHOD|mmetsp:Transcript_9328/g.13624  ORF Transcript_9328/g.13624 Transcript_9328/m.13624 type:complete len:121 (+) Transcript_9328:170-532(+)